MKRLYNSHLFNPRANILTKAVSGKVFHDIIDKLGMIDIYTPT